MSDPLHYDPAEQAGGLNGQHEDYDDQRHGELLAVADDVDAGHLLDHVAAVGDHVLEYADDEAADHSAARIADAAHHVGIEVDDVRHHHAGDGAYRRRKAPAQRQHPVDTDADQPGHLRILR